MSWKPVEVSLGKLPEFDQQMIAFYLGSGGQVPDTAKEILIFTFITSIGEEGELERGYYEFSTSDGVNDYKQYMNVATGQGINIVNSANLWIPVTAERTLKVKLHHSTSQRSKKKSIAGKCAGKDWSEVFVTGYR